MSFEDSQHRFKVTPRVLYADFLATHLIRFGGIGIILAVSVMFLFIGWQIIPLFRSASLSPQGTIQTPAQATAFLGVDEWTRLPFLATAEGEFVFINVAPNASSGKIQITEQGLLHKKIELSENEKITASTYLPEHQSILFGTNLGHYLLVAINYRATFQDDQRTIGVQLQQASLAPSDLPRSPIAQIAYGESDTYRVIASLHEAPEGFGLHGTRFRRKTNLMGEGLFKFQSTHDLTSKLPSKPRQIRVNQEADRIFVLDANSDISIFHFKGSDYTLAQHLRISEETSAQIVDMQWIQGNESLLVFLSNGQNWLLSPAVDPQSSKRYYAFSKNLPDLSGVPDTYAKSTRNRSILITRGKKLLLAYATTAQKRLELELPFLPAITALSSRHEHLLALDAKGSLHFYALKDPHPEASLKAFFAPIKYEGKPHPVYQWQSTGASQDFEPKLSMMPIIFGSLKGTFYAMLFAAPIALLAALYTARFLKPSYKKIIKPFMEIMASLPSVILGFLAAFWLAPLVEDKILSLLTAFILIPTFTILFAWAWGRLSHQFGIQQGYEHLLLIPVVCFAVALGLYLGPIIEQAFFTIDENGTPIASFGLWWTQTFNLPFDQRNALVVGFMMGFAVIPIIFTIAEDAMSNVPKSMTSASLALGASPWQTAWRIILPAASSGIFSAFIIGFGRAVGETMIVLMASGNTPLIGWNPFEGMRTLATNIAVELPEAPQYSTLYRALFLGAFLLFLFTFILNTIAELARARLRAKYKAID